MGFRWPDCGVSVGHLKCQLRRLCAASWVDVGVFDMNRWLDEGFRWPVYL